MKKIIFALGIYDTTDLFSHCLSKAFENRGYESVFLDVSDETNMKKCLKSLDTSQILAAVVFNNLAYSVELSEDENFWEKEKIPYINLLLDHPFHYKKQLQKLPSTATIFCTDKNHVMFLKKYEPSLKAVYFIPHGGVSSMEEQKPIKERKIEILYAGSLPFERASLLIPDLSQETKFDALKLSKEVLESLIASPDQTTEEAIEKYLLQNKISLTQEELYEVIYKMRFLDSYATSYYREQAIRVLVEAGLDVTVYGGGWEICAWTKNPHFLYQGNVFAPEILPIMQESQIVLNTQTWYKNGGHDRIYNGMLAKSCVVSDTSLYLTDTLRADKEIVFFQRDKIESLPQKIGALLEDKHALQQIADAGYAHAKKYDTWEERANTILSFLEEENRTI